MGVLKGFLKRLNRSLGASLRPTSLLRYGWWPGYVRADERLALTVATVYRCIKILSDSVASLPLEYQRLDSEVFRTDHRHPLAPLLEVEADVAVSAFDLKRRAIQQVLLDGNAYIIPVYSVEEMAVTRLVLCGRGTVEHNTQLDQYRVNDPEQGLVGTFDESEVIHLKGLTLRPSDKVGYGVIAFAAKTAGIAAAGDLETAKRFETSGTPRGILTNEKSGVRAFNEYSDGELRKAAVDIEGRWRSGEYIVSIPGQADFKQMSMSSADMQFLESRKFTVLEICRFFGVHPSFVYSDTSSNYKSAEQASVAFLNQTLNPMLIEIEEEFRRKLIPRELWPYRRIKFDRSGLYACDLESKAKYESMLLGMGYTINELRRMNNRPPVPGGDVVMLSANLKTLNQIKQEGNQKGNNEQKGNDDTASVG